MLTPGEIAIKDQHGKLHKGYTLPGTYSYLWDYLTFSFNRKVSVKQPYWFFFFNQAYENQKIFVYFSPRYPSLATKENVHVFISQGGLKPWDHLSCINTFSSLLPPLPFRFVLFKSVNHSSLSFAAVRKQHGRYLQFAH